MKTRFMSVIKELQNYIDEPKLNKDSDPLLEFWKLKKFQYPRLSILARKYLTVQATNTPSERVFSKIGNNCFKEARQIDS